MTNKHRISVSVPVDIEDNIRALRLSDKRFLYMPTSKIICELCQCGIKYIDEQDPKEED